MNGTRILIVEDEPRVADFLSRGLRAEGYAVEVARDGHDGLEMARSQPYAAIVLDLMLPGLDGRAVCQALRRDGNSTAVLMLTAMDTLEDKLGGFAIGADDYLTKPFAFDELLARLAALIRRSRVPLRSAEPDRRLLRAGDIAFDRDTLTVTRGGRRIELTAKEMALLEILMSSPGRVFSRERILSHVWGLVEDPLTNVVDVYIHRLRRKLEEGSDAGPVIVTIRSHGYRLQLPADQAAG